MRVLAAPLTPLSSSAQVTAPSQLPVALWGPPPFTRPSGSWRECGAPPGAVYSHVADQLALSLEATPPGTYHQRGVNSLQRLFREHFPELLARFEEFAQRLGKFRLERITKAVERFMACGDYRRGVARVRCTNPRCGAEYFRPFSCSVFHLCPSCSQKRTLLFGEYMNEQLLLRLPHRQFVFTFPKVLRVFFRHDKSLHGEISRLIYALVRDFATEAAGKPIRTAAVVVFQSAGEFSRWNPHWHSLVLEGGFDQEGRFVHIPKIDLKKMSACFRQRVIGFFLDRKLLDERLAKNMVQWAHSGFSVDYANWKPDARGRSIQTG